MSRSYKRPTKAEAARMARLKEMRCVACSKHHYCTPGGPVHVHHLLSGNKRRGHMFTIPLCQWHHVGVSPLEKRWNMEVFIGPSLALSSKRFHALFGTDDELLSMTNTLLEKQQ